MAASSPRAIRASSSVASAAIQLQVVVRDAAQLAHAAARSSAAPPTTDSQIDEGARSATVPTRSGVAALAAASVALADAGIEVDDLGCASPRSTRCSSPSPARPPPDQTIQLEEATR